MKDDDAALMAAVRSRSDQAFNILIDRHQQAVQFFLRRLLGDASEADDIAQETFLAAWVGAGAFREQASIRSWLCAIAWRKARSAQRSRFRRRAREASYHDWISNDSGAPASAEDRLAVQQALLTLPMQERAAVTLCLACEFSHTEAANILGIPLGTVKTHVAQGRVRILKAIGESA
jgi:RNA polymerase sigma-70 factor (ECF subfamily)